MIFERVDVIEFDDTGCDLLDKKVRKLTLIMKCLTFFMLPENFVARVIRLILSTHKLVGLTCG